MKKTIMNMIKAIIAILRITCIVFIPVTVLDLLLHVAYGGVVSLIWNIVFSIILAIYTLFVYKV